MGASFDYIVPPLGIYSRGSLLQVEYKINRDEWGITAANTLVNIINNFGPTIADSICRELFPKEINPNPGHLLTFLGRDGFTIHSLWFKDLMKTHGYERPLPCRPLLTDEGFTELVVSLLPAVFVGEERRIAVDLLSKFLCWVVTNSPPRSYNSLSDFFGSKLWRDMKSQKFGFAVHPFQDTYYPRTYASAITGCNVRNHEVKAAEQIKS